MEMTIYRYESPFDEDGFYRADEKPFNNVEEVLDFQRKVCREHSWKSDGHPILYEDLPVSHRGMISKYYSTCDTINKLRKWFKGYNREILKHGFVLVEYVVSDYVPSLSGKQCFFAKSEVIERKVLKSLVY
jgi:hypothetical protein